MLTATEITTAIEGAGRTISAERADALALFCNGWRSLDDARDALSWADHLATGFNREQLQSDLGLYQAALDAALPVEYFDDPDAASGHVTTLGQFLTDNNEEFDVWRRLAITKAIRAGEAFFGNEGAGGCWKLAPAKAAQRRAA